MLGVSGLVGCLLCSRTPAGFELRPPQGLLPLERSGNAFKGEDDSLMCAYVLRKLTWHVAGSFLRAGRRHLLPCIVLFEGGPG